MIPLMTSLTNESLRSQISSIDSIESQKVCHTKRKSLFSIIWEMFFTFCFRSPSLQSQDFFSLFLSTLSKALKNYFSCLITKFKRRVRRFHQPHPRSNVVFFKKKKCRAILGQFVWLFRHEWMLVVLSISSSHNTYQNIILTPTRLSLLSLMLS